MFSKISNSFKKMPVFNKSMVYLNWFYFLWQTVMLIFVSVYVLKFQNSFLDLIIYNAVFTFSAFVWFFISGFWVSKFHKSSKNIYYFSYLFFTLSFILLLLLNDTFVWILLFWIIYWSWFWAFWCANHCLELAYIEDKERDLYSSVMAAWNSLIRVVLPIIISWVFFLLTFTKFDPYLIIFLFIPFVYTFSFKFINKLPDYIPKSIEKGQFKEFFNIKKHLNGHIFMLFYWLDWSLSSLLLPGLSILFLQNEVNIWLFNWLLAFISSYIVVHLWLQRLPHSRFKHYASFIGIWIFNLLLLSFFFNIYMYFLFSFLLLLTWPLVKSSQHTYNLALMDNFKSDKSWFMLGMIWREFVLLIWRILWFIISFFLFLTTSWNLELTLRYLLFLIWVSLIFKLLFIKRWELSNKKDT